MPPITNLKAAVRGRVKAPLVTKPGAAVQGRVNAASVANLKAAVRGRAKATLDAQPSESSEPRSMVDGAQDGSKYIGHFARENGRYGSMPMHDDYGDEGDA